VLQRLLQELFGRPLVSSLMPWTALKSHSRRKKLATHKTRRRPLRTIQPLIRNSTSHDHARRRAITTSAPRLSPYLSSLRHMRHLRTIDISDLHTPTLHTSIHLQTPTTFKISGHHNPCQTLEHRAIKGDTNLSDPRARYYRAKTPSSTWLTSPVTRSSPDAKQVGFRRFDHL